MNEGVLTTWVVVRLRDSIVVSISACHVEDPGSIPGRGAETFFFLSSREACT